MPVRELKAAYENFRGLASVVDRNDHRNSLQLTRVTEAITTFCNLINANSQVDVDEFLQDDPKALRLLAFKPEANLALINKASSIALNRALEFLTRNMMEGGAYYHHSALLAVLKKFSRRC
jgi:hypothetical protein